MPKRRKYLALALLLYAVVASLAFAFAGNGSAFPFRSVTPGELARGGLTLSSASPPANLPITAADASAAASKFQGGRRALEVHYAHCVDTDKVPRLSEGCWAVSIDPHGLKGTGGPHRFGTSGSKVRARSNAFHYDVVFVDANSGKVIEATRGS